MSSLITKSQFVQEFPKDDPECIFINKMMEMTPDVVRNIFRNTEHNTKCHGIFPSCKLPQDYAYGNIPPEIKAFPKHDKPNVYESKFSSNSNSTIRMDSGEQGHHEEIPENYENFKYGKPIYQSMTTISKIDPMEDARQDLIYSDSEEDENQNQVQTSSISNAPLNNSIISNNKSNIKDEPLSQNKQSYDQKSVLENLDQCSKRLPNLNNFHQFENYFHSDRMLKSEPKTNSYGSGGDTEPFEECQDTNESNIGSNSLHKAPKSTDKSHVNTTYSKETAVNENDILKFINTVDDKPSIKVKPVYGKVYDEINQKRKIRKESSVSNSVTPAKVQKFNNPNNNISNNNENTKSNMNKPYLKKDVFGKEKCDSNNKQSIHNSKSSVNHSNKNVYNFNKNKKYLIEWSQNQWTVHFGVNNEPNDLKNLHKINSNNHIVQSNNFGEQHRTLETQKSMPFDSINNASSTPTSSINKKSQYINSNSTLNNTLIFKSSSSSINSSNHQLNNISSNTQPNLSNPSNTNTINSATLPPAHHQQNNMASSLSLSQNNTKKPQALAKQIFIQTPQYNQKYNNAKFAVVKGNPSTSNHNENNDNDFNNSKSNSQTNLKLSTPIDRKKENATSNDLSKSIHNNSNASNKSINNSSDNDPDESTIIKGLLLLQRSRYAMKKDFINRMKQLDTKQWLSDADGLKQKADRHKNTSEYPAYILISLKKYLIYNYSLDVKNDSRRCHYSYVENAKFVQTICESITKVFRNKMAQMDKKSEEYFYWTVLNVFTLTFCLRIRAILNYRAYRNVSEHCSKLQKMLSEKKLFDSAVSLMTSENDNRQRSPSSATSAPASSSTSQAAMHLDKYFRYSSIISSAYRHWEKAETNESKFMEKDQRHEDAWKEMSCEIIERSGGADLSGLNESMPIVIKYIDGFIQLFIEKFLGSNNDMVQLSCTDSYLLNGDVINEAYSNNNI